MSAEQLEQDRRAVAAWRKIATRNQTGLQGPALDHIRVARNDLIPLVEAAERGLSRRQTDYDDATDCPICPMVATDRDDALADARELRGQLEAAWADADQLAAAFHENLSVHVTVAEGLRCLDAHQAHKAAVAARSKP